VKTDKVDAVIVGAGPAGTILASRLSASGKKVVILELGPNWQIGDLISSQIWSRRIKWGDAPVENAGADPAGYNFNMGWGSGGSAIHHYGQWPRLHREDFRMRSLFGRGVDWPIDYDELRPYYDRVQEDVGVSGDHLREPWRPEGAPYPLPPLQSFRQAEVLAAGFQKVGIRAAPMPLAILSQNYRGRPACLNDGWCDAGCPIGALANPFFADLPNALKNGTELRSRAYATRVLTQRDGQRASAVEYVDATGHSHTQHADVVILANNCIQGSRLLLHSSSDEHPNGLANSSGTVGQYILTHFDGGISALFDEDMQNHMGTTGAAMISQESYGRAEGSYTYFIGYAHKMSDLLGIANAKSGLFGQALHDFVKRAARGLGSVNVIGEQSPRAENRIALTDKKDARGVPIARWYNAINDTEKSLWAKMQAETVSALKAGGAVEIMQPRSWGFQHIAGGLRMGSKPGESVCDSYGRCHDVSNLIIAGAGIFPTQGAVNPTFTVHALTHRTADHLLAHWGSFTV